MTKTEYMEALQNKLESFNRELQQEIMEDYERHFAEGIAAGKTEEEIVAELGSIEDMISDLPEEDIKQEIQLPEESRRSDAYEGQYKAVVIDGLVADVNLEQSDDGRLYVDYHNDVDQRYRFYQYEEGGIFYVGVRKNGSTSEKEAKRAMKIMLFGKELDLGNAFDSIDRAFDDIDRTFSGMGKSFSVNSGDIALDIKIPAGMPRVELKTLSGDLDVRDVTPEQLSIHTTSGDIEIRHVTADGMRVNATSGDIIGSQISCTDLNVNVTSGDLELEDAEATMLYLNTTSGDISGNYMRGNIVEIGTASGDVDFRGRFERFSIRTGSGDADIRVEDQARDIRINTGSGDVELDVTAVQGAKVTVSTGSGEGTVYESSSRATHKVNRGSCTVGSGDCLVYVSTGSGDAEVKCR